MIKVVKLFCYNQNFVPWGLSALVPGLYTCIKLCNIQMYSSLKLVSVIYTRSHMGPSVERVLIICSNGSAPLNKVERHADTW